MSGHAASGMEYHIADLMLGRGQLKRISYFAQLGGNVMAEHKELVSDVRTDTGGARAATHTTLHSELTYSSVSFGGNPCKETKLFKHISIPLNH